MRDKSSKGKPSQELIQFSEIRDGVVIMPDGTLRSTLIVSSLNFALKSEDEQNAIIFAFQNFLNSLDFPIQISISSRKLDITPYLEELRMRREQQSNELLRLQMDEYMNFISELVKGSDIMTKTFFITVPFSVHQSQEAGIFKKFMNIFLKAGAPKKKQQGIGDVEFEHFKVQLLQRVEQVAVGLRSIGLRLVPLQTQELLELFYNMYNPVTSRNQRLYNVAQLNVQETNPAELQERQQVAGQNKI